jgi:hypothetical protein
MLGLVAVREHSVITGHAVAAAAPDIESGSGFMKIAGKSLWIAFLSVSGEIGLDTGV